MKQNDDLWLLNWRKLWAAHISVGKEREVKQTEWFLCFRKRNKRLVLCSEVGTEILKDSQSAVRSAV